MVSCGIGVSVAAARSSTTTAFARPLARSASASTLCSCAWPRPFFAPCGLIARSLPMNVSSASTSPPPEPNTSKAPSRIASRRRWLVNHAVLWVTPNVR